VLALLVAAPSAFAGGGDHRDGHGDNHGHASRSAIALAGALARHDSAHGGDQRGGGWVAAWQGSPTLGGTFPGVTCPSDTGLNNQTVRNVVFVSAGGHRVAVRLTNAYGAEPLRVGSASVAVAADGGRTVPGTTRALRFGGKSSIVIAAGGEALSDPVSLRVRALQTLAISVYLPKATGPATQHFFSNQENYIATGDHALASDAEAFDTTITCWMFADGVDVRAPRRVRGTVVALGDSITDGYGSTVNANLRYPDQLARRLNAQRGRTLSAVNAGIIGNTLLRPPDLAIFGETASARLDRDVLTQTGVTDVILLEGINDIGMHGSTAEDLIDVQQQIVAEAHALGVKIYGATLLPFGGSNAEYGGEYGTAAGEAQRQAVNHWIRTSGTFDGVFDFDRSIRDPQDPTRMLPEYDSGDHLHPNDAGLGAMASVVDIKELVR
jgi:lysophospholipase L1-like esterase